MAEGAWHGENGFLANNVNDSGSVDTLELSTVVYNATTPRQRNEELAKIEIAVQAVIFALAVISNSLVLIVLLCVRRKKLNRMYLMVVHLTCADLFVAFFNVLPMLFEDILVQFYGGNVVCKLVRYFQVVAMYASSYVLVSTAIDRYLAICHPLTAKTWTNSKMHILVAVAWGFSLLFSIPQMVIFSYVEGSENQICNASFDPAWTIQLYITSITVAIYIIPAVLLAIAYGRICYTVWKSTKVREGQLQGSGHGSQHLDSHRSHHKKSSSSENGELLSRSIKGASNIKMSANPNARTSKGASKSKVKTVKLTLTVIVCYLLCWGPFFVIQLWAAWDPEPPMEEPEMVIIMLLASLNSCTNPWIYLFFVDNICSKIRQLVSTGAYNGGAGAHKFSSVKNQKA